MSDDGPAKRRRPVGAVLASGGYRLAKPVLFRLGGGDAETAHEWTMKRLTRVSKTAPVRRTVTRMLATEPSPIRVFGVDFPNRVGLAAGMDKDGRALKAWPALGLGFVEVGTVTWHPQPGNPRPRLFRLTNSNALINRMGFNNAGARALATTLAKVGPIGVPLGISLGKSKITPIDEAIDDYVASLHELRQYADYIAINVSSPNTPGLRSLQDRGYLSELLAALVAEAGDVPVLVKVAPDLTEDAVGELLGVLDEHRAAGIIATNTTLERHPLDPADADQAAQTGGLSGAPLTERSREMVRFIHRESGGTLPIIGVGGIGSGEDAKAMIDAGAALVQIYSGLIYRGPRLIGEATRATARSVR
ncbi:dihydroorotate oxidase A [Antricoccus suffuscus]|uniref:Dihydroorotate dehydrogenase (quinone) n=1 Tax=Antricoccus suffuscus TaxID=1629062 RepID=A0A2T0ZWD2_9ACTN|nr:quinone-dependent dihydroorotate dehydrogenase [Antricoccus suffuscus]PRZ40650.1 dihydroorotate oxidase A [Antricoccus suffuscus]